MPTIQKMGIYLDKVVDWEAFGYQLLPEDKEHLMEVIIKASLTVITYSLSVSRHTILTYN